MKNVSIFGVVIAAVVASGCTRIETGEVGLRRAFDKQIEMTEIPAGQMPQTIVGDVLVFPIKQLSILVDDVTPLAKDNSTMQEVDYTVVYSVNPSSVAELYVNKNRSFHAVDERTDETYLMYNYVMQASRNALYKSARDYEALLMNDSRAEIEQKMKDIIAATLTDEGLDKDITIHQVLVRKIQPAESVVKTANELVAAKNDKLKKEVEVQTAQLESQRMQALANQSEKSIDYMNAQANLMIAEGVKAGKVQTIIIPSNMTGLMITK